VLIQGETGTGKELAARALHFQSRRREDPFVPVNCAALAESLLTSQLFGHRRGAFTGALADQKGVFESAGGGTIFLDEIGDMPLPIQTSLLRVLQEREITRLGESLPREIDVRVVAATHCELRQKVEEGSFREDLFYRIHGHDIILPPLRDRPEDILPLALHFADRTATRADKPVPEISKEALACLLALQEAEGNRSDAARRLGIGRATLYRRLDDLDVGPKAGARGPRVRGRVRG
jgi:transcriptional regulator with PAS, ATPase and Fis domain